MQLIHYLNETFFTENQLLAACQIDAGTLAQLQQRRIMPLPSYHLRLRVDCDSVFGAHSEQSAIAYYAKGYVDWVGILPTLADDGCAFERFATRYRRRAQELMDCGIAPRHEKLNAGMAAHLRSEWEHFLNGTYGLCTRSGLPDDIATKEVAAMMIDEILAEADKRALTSTQCAALQQAVDLLDSASAQFAPHEVARSSRQRLISDVRAKHLR
ncbi:DUF6058 family natural product biosynthesis protein [Massilia glaciei]|uniref:Uncharacterized protein n=1 Tax=Massilia glaciei TaxID=1524097 RepID=A0A2U2I716_9BURK|nr:DUF6058 family natural product biosynthesis protein [Massilia glaciei]PWF55554.1 hypothetical protein C7C56_001140 [Massilia glaciei]